MNKDKHRYAGFGVVEIIAIAATLVIVGAVTWNYFFSGNTQNNKPTVEEKVLVKEAPVVDTTNDLDDASRYLIDMNIDEQLDTGEIDDALNEQP